MDNEIRDPRRREMRKSIERDMKRLRKREPADRSFWRSIGVLGAVGWPIAIVMVASAWMGSWLDRRWDTGVRLTLLLVFLGAGLGGSIAWSVIQGTKK